jgi:4a-hydroxytetrahydrobiopterin dehydratase
MTERRKLTEAEVTTALAGLDGWELREGKLRRQFRFDTFARAMGWMVAVAIAADKLDHHPDWSNSYNKVDVSLHTHDMEALSTYDIELAREMQRLYRD